MNEKRFAWKTEKLQHLNDEVLMVVDNTNKDWKGHILNIVDLLNQLDQENEHLIIGNKNLMKKNEQLKEENEQLRQFINKGRRLSVKEIMNNINENESLKKKIKELEKENDGLKQQLLYKGDDVCSICKHEYLVPSGDYFISKCEKGHEECSKEDIKYCEDFELIQVDFEDLIKRMNKELEK